MDWKNIINMTKNMENTKNKNGYEISSFQSYSKNNSINNIIILFFTEVKSKQNIYNSYMFNELIQPKKKRQLMIGLRFLNFLNCLIS